MDGWNQRLLKHPCKNYKALLKTREDMYIYPIIGKWAQFEEHLIKSFNLFQSKCAFNWNQVYEVTLWS